MNKLVATKLTCLLIGVLSASAAMDDARLKEWLTGNFTAPESMTWEGIDGFKAQFDVTDPQLHRVLIGIYREAEAKWPELTVNTIEWGSNVRTVEGVLTWLPKCGEIPAKGLLLDFAADASKVRILRTTAILSYLRVSDAAEARDALVRFLVGADRLDYMGRLSVYSHAEAVYGTSDAIKRQAILAALFVATAREEGKIEFMKADRILCTRSDAYRRSRQRLALLERHSLEPPTANIYTDRDLKAALNESRMISAPTSISTNLDVLKRWDPSQPLPQMNGASVNITVPPPEVPAAALPSGDDTERTSARIFYIGGASALVLVAGGVWMWGRRRPASRL